MTKRIDEEPVQYTFDLRQIREQLNELPFKNGRREVRLGAVAEIFEDAGPQAINKQLSEWEDELRQHTLILERRKAQRDSLYVVQELRALPVDLSWMPVAMQWVSRITTVAMEMVLPGLLGWWLDGRFGTSFLVVIGLAIGVPLGIWHLLQMTKARRSDTSSKT